MAGRRPGEPCGTTMTDQSERKEQVAMTDTPHDQGSPDVVAAAPSDPNTLTSALNIRTADIQAVYQLWSSRGARFLTPPMNHSAEIRCYLRDPDGHLIEVGQTTARAAG